MPAPNVSARLAKLSVILVFALMSLSLATTSRAQNAAQPFVAPVPPQLVDSTIVFLSNGGVSPDLRDRITSAGPNANTPYNQLYDALQNSKRFRLASTPGAAELVFELSFTDPATTCGNDKTCTAMQMELVIYDVKTHFRLWTFIEPVDSALLNSNFVKNLNATVAALVADVNTITTAPPK
jgi:hypothetical protein